MSAEGRTGIGAVRRAVMPAAVRLPPIRRRDFWAVQGLVFVIAGTHTLLETVGRVHFPPELYLIPTSLFFVPVVYAAVRFGARGSIITAIWSIVLTLPNIVLLHEGLVRVGIAWQLLILLLIGAFVGERVDRERRARAETEERERERRASEEHYRALFDGAAEAILVIDGEGIIEEANAAAAQLLDRDAKALAGMRFEEAASAALAAAIAGGMAESATMRLPDRAGGDPRWVQAVSSGPLATADGRTHVHAMLRDVTLQHERQQGLEQYARQTVAAREEERRQIGRELHDGPLQSLVLVGRTIDAIVDARTPSDGARAVADAREIVDATAAELRRLSRSLRPSILDDLGLVAALRSEVIALGRRAALDARFGVIGRPCRVASEVELMLLRVTQEALHNIERHAGASRVGVRIAFAPGSIVLVIRDDGRGPGAIPSAAALLADGKMGLVGMEERVRLAGGELSAGGGRSHGTTIRVRVPSGGMSPG